MGDRERNLELVRAGLEAYGRGDQEAVLDFLDPEIETHVSDRMLNSGTWHGIPGFLEGIGAWNDAWDDYRLEITGIEAVDDRNVVVDVHQTAVGRESGVPVEMDVVFLYEVTGERATRFHIYPDRTDAIAAI
jgi:ketosteroid isomerase-like protein